MSPESLIVSYGYPMLFVGVMFEGETFLINRRGQIYSDSPPPL